MIKKELIQKAEAFIKAEHDGQRVAIWLPEFMAEFTFKAIADHDAKAWKAYPENKP